MKEKEEEEDDNEDDLHNVEKGDEYLDRLTGDSIAIPSKFKSNNCFIHFYFWLFYIFTISCFSDIYLYTINYQLFPKKIFAISIFYARIISDLLMVIPNFIFTKRAIVKNKQIKAILCGLIYFLPQLAINIISLVFLYFLEETIMNISFNNSDEKRYLMVSTIINAFLNLLCSFFSIIKIYLNY